MRAQWRVSRNSRDCYCCHHYAPHPRGSYQRLRRGRIEDTKCEGRSSGVRRRMKRRCKLLFEALARSLVCTLIPFRTSREVILCVGVLLVLDFHGHTCAREISPSRQRIECAGCGRPEAAPGRYHGAARKTYLSSFRLVACGCTPARSRKTQRTTPNYYSSNVRERNSRRPQPHGQGEEQKRFWSDLVALLRDSARANPPLCALVWSARAVREEGKVETGEESARGEVAKTDSSILVGRREREERLEAR